MQETATYDGRAAILFTLPHQHGRSGLDALGARGALARQQAAYDAAAAYFAAIARARPTARPTAAVAAGAAAERSASADSGFRGFVAGYQSQGGNAAWLTHFVNDVLPCEGGVWSGYYGDPYWTRAQFSQDTWEKVTRQFNLTTEAQQRGAADEPEFVGVATAWWSGEISAPGDRSGWPSCWWVGVVP